MASRTWAARRKRAAELYMRSSNRKLSPVEMVPTPHLLVKQRPEPRPPYCAVTFTSIEATCSDRCPFKEKNGTRQGCLAQAGYTRRIVQRLDGAADRREMTPLDVIKEEVAIIDRAGGPRGCTKPGRIPQDGARGGRDLRLHAVGDVGTRRGARLLAGAAHRWRERGGGSVWTYTHDWRHVPRSDWGDRISVLASVESTRGIRAAMRRGYAAAVPNGDRSFRLESVPEVRIVPCPAQTRKTTCVECRLCLDRDLHSMGVAIAFTPHGQDGEIARTHSVRHLPVVQ